MTARSVRCWHPSLGDRATSLTARADFTFLGALPDDATARAAYLHAAWGEVLPPYGQVKSVTLECGPHAQLAKVSPPAEPCTLRALVGGSPCPSAAGFGWPEWGQPQLRAEQPSRQSCAHGCAGWVLLSTEMFVAGPETVLQDPFMTWLSEHLLGQQSTSGFLQLLPLPTAPPTWKEESLLRNCLAWCCSEHTQCGLGLLRYQHLLVFTLDMGR